MIQIPIGMPDSEWMEKFWKAAGYSLLTELLTALWLTGWQGKHPGASD